MEDNNRSRLAKLKVQNARLHLKIFHLRRRLSAPQPLPVPNLVSRNSGQTTLPNQLQYFQGHDKSIMLGIAANAIDEATRLLKFNEPLWVKNPAGRFVLDHNSYVRIFPKPGLENFNDSFESSKDDGFVRMSGKQLVDVILDAGKWAAFFPTILIKAETIQEFDSGTAEIRNGCLKLMYAKMHILSHLVAARELFFVRYCQQIGEGVWVIADVTHDYFFKANQNPSPSWCWRLPSGCMIQDMSNGWSKVTWMEHTNFKENVTRHPLYKDYVNHESAYGAERWLAALQRTCERFACSMIQLEPNQTLGGLSSEGRRSIMSLAQRMIKNFCDSLAMNSEVEFPDVSNSSDSGVQISVHNSIQGQPDGIIATATESFWLPQPFQTVFNFLMDKERRPEWDVLSGGKSLQETMNISCGTQPGNCISILQPQMPGEPNYAMLQETYIGPLGSLQVYAPIDLEILNREISTGLDHSPNIQILPSGFLVSRDGYFGPASSHISTSNIMGSNCSLTTMVYQVLIRDPSNLIVEQSVATIKAVTRAATQKIKKALGCDELDR